MHVLFHTHNANVAEGFSLAGGPHSAPWTVPLFARAESARSGPPFVHFVENQFKLR